MTPCTRRSIVVTGATGFLGRQILAALAARPESDVRVIAACREPSRLPRTFRGEVLRGDLRDAEHRRVLVEAADAICHAGTWGAFWGHGELERRNFLEPTLDLVERSVARGIDRFLLASTVAVAPGRRDHTVVEDDAPPQRTGFWPHLDCLIEVDERMRERATARSSLVNMRLGHFVGVGNRLGLVPALIPRLRTRLVPWLAGGHARMPLVSDADLGEAFALGATAPGLAPYESLHIVGDEQPTFREVVALIAGASVSPTPLFSVPYRLGYAFAALMETLHPVLPGSSPFLSRSLVHVAESRLCATDRARRVIGFSGRKSWRIAVREAVAELGLEGFPWPRLAQGAEA